MTREEEAIVDLAVQAAVQKIKRLEGEIDTLTTALAASRARVTQLQREVAEGFKVEVTEVTGDAAMMAENGLLKEKLRGAEREKEYLDQCINGLHGWKQIQAETAKRAEHAEQRAEAFQRDAQRMEGHFKTAEEARLIAEQRVAGLEAALLRLWPDGTVEIGEVTPTDAAALAAEVVRVTLARIMEGNYQDHEPKLWTDALLTFATHEAGAGRGAGRM